MSEELELREKVKTLETVVAGLERILKLQDEELANAETMIAMYEQITEFARRELMDARETQAASEEVSRLSTDELKSSLTRIKELETANRKLKEERQKSRG